MTSRDEASAPLHTMNPTGRFGDRAEDYRKHRPGYPAGAVDAVVEGLPRGAVAADVGAGTGIFSRLLAERGLRVIAIEPNASMRAAAGPEERVRWVDGTAEATGLEDESVDLVTCAQAFHWFKHVESLREFHRILKPDAHLALVWNQRDSGDPLTRGYIEAIRAVGGEHPAEARPVDVMAVSAEGLFSPPREARFANEQTLTREGLLGRALSASYTPKDGASRSRLEAMLGELFEQHCGSDGLVRLRYSTVVYLAAAMK